MKGWPKLVGQEGKGRRPRGDALHALSASSPWEHRRHPHCLLSLLPESRWVFLQGGKSSQRSEVGVCPSSGGEAVTKLTVW